MIKNILKLLLCCICWGVGFLHARSVYTSPVIIINTQDVNANVAKDKGFETAIEGAWHSLADKILFNPEDAKKITKAHRNGFIKKIDVLSEQTHSNRYGARIIIYFDSVAIQDYLRDKNITFIEDQGFPALIVPVFEYKGVKQMFEPTNMWQTALQNVESRGGLLPLFVSNRGVKDSLIMDRYILTNKDKMLRVIASYDADMALVAHARVLDTKIVLEYTAIGGILDGKKYTLTQSIPDTQGDTDKNRDDLVLDALGDLSIRFFIDAEHQWKKQHAVAEKQGVKNIKATFSLQSLQEWHTLKQTLESYHMVRSVDLHSVQGNIITASIRYTGVLKNFYVFLEEKKYIIQKYNTVWIINHKHVELSDI